MTKRRTRGDGGLYQRHDHPTCPPRAQVGVDEDGKPLWERPEHKCRGRWVGNIEVYVNGKRRRKSVYGSTQRKARVNLAAALRDRDKGTLVIASMTTGDWLDHWLNDIAATELRPQTIRGYQSKVDVYLKPALGRIRLTDLQPEHVRQMHAFMRNKGLAEASVRQAHVILARALKIAVREGKLGSSPTDRMDPPSTDVNKRTPLTLPQARAVLRAAGDDARWWLALFYGMRQGEVLGLRWSDIDLERRVLRISQSLQKDVDDKLIFGPPKSKSSRRAIPLLPQVEVRLRIMWLNEGQPSDDRLVFHNKGRPVQPKLDWRRWRELLDLASVPPLAQIPQVPLHTARNTAASLLEEAGVPDRLVAQILGHGQVQITHGYQVAEVERMAAALTSLAGLLELE